MTKYHISKNGEPAICNARIQCRLADASEHYDSPEEARKAFEEENASKSTVTLKKIEEWRNAGYVRAVHLKADITEEYHYEFKEQSDGRLKVDLYDEDNLFVASLTVSPENERKAIDRLAFAGHSWQASERKLDEMDMEKLSKAHDVWAEAKGTREDRMLAFAYDRIATKFFEKKPTLDELKEIAYSTSKSKKYNREFKVRTKKILEKIDAQPAARKTAEALF